MRLNGVSRGRRVSSALVAVAAVVGLTPFALSVDASEAPLQKVGEFRPFGAHNKLGGSAFVNVVDSARGNWFFSTPIDPATGAVSTPRIWQFHLDGPRQVGAALSLPGGVSYPLMGAIDPTTGHFLHVHGGDATPAVAVIAATPKGPSLVTDWNATDAMKGTGPYELMPKAIDVVGTKAYIAADAPNWVPGGETVVFQIDIPKLLAGQDPVDWRYRLAKCPAVPLYQVQGAVGKSRTRPVLSVPCRAPLGGSDMQGVAVVELPSMTPTNTAGFVDRFYPIAGDYRKAESYYDPVADRIAMRRIGPAQLVVFDVEHRRWMRPVLFGQENMYQSALDPTTGRIYGLGNDPGDGNDREFLFVPETRPTPPQNGLATQVPRDALAAYGQLAIDTNRRLFFVGDVDAAGTPSAPVADGLYFHIYRDNRPPFDAGVGSDPDEDIVNLSAESQGYGARVSYVGGLGGTYSNVLNTDFPVEATVAGASRHVTFARTLRLRMTEGEASAEATASHPEGASEKELNDRDQRWPHQPVACLDFGRAPTTARDASLSAEVLCDLEYPQAGSKAVYEAESNDPYKAPVQRASTASRTTIHRTKGVAVTVTSEGSLDIPGVVSIGSMRATATTFAAGKKGTAESTYVREMKDVAIAGQPYCSSDCDPDDVAAEINRQFAPAAASGTLVVADAPDPDPQLRSSPGGAQAIVQRDRYAHEEDVGTHDIADDRFELPAFTVVIYQDRQFPQHEVYSLAAVQAVSRLPQSLADDLDELAGPDDDPFTSFGSTVTASGPQSLADFDAPVGPAGSSLSAPTRPPSRRGPPSVGFTERMAWTLASPLRSPGMLAILAFFAVPVYLSSRRWLLLAYRPTEAGDVDAA